MPHLYNDPYIEGGLVKIVDTNTDILHRKSAHEKSAVDFNFLFFELIDFALDVITDSGWNPVLCCGPWPEGSLSYDVNECFFEDGSALGFIGKKKEAGWIVANEWVEVAAVREQRGDDVGPDNRQRAVEGGDLEKDV